MQWLVVLALVAFTGCQANILRPEEPKPQVDIVKDAFWKYFIKATKTTQDALETIRESETGQHVYTKIKDSVGMVQLYTAIVHDQVFVFGWGSYPKVSELADLLSERLEHNLKEVRAQLELYAQQLKASIEQQVEKLGQAVAPYTESQDTKSLKATFDRKSEELMEALGWTATELHSLLGPSTKELQETLEQRLREILKSLTQPGSLLGEISHGSYRLYEAMMPYANDLNKKLDPYTKDLESWLNSLWKSLTKGA